MCRGICRGWWRRCSGRLRRPGICSSRSGWSTCSGVVVAPAAEFFVSWLGAGARRRRTGRMEWMFFAGSGSCGRRGSAGIRRPALRPGISAAGSGGLTSRCGGTGGIPVARAPGAGTAVAPGTPNPVTGKRSPGRGYAAATVVHCESVLRGFLRFPPGGWHRADGEPVPAGRGGGVAGRTRITTRCSRSRPSALAGTGRRWPGGCRGRSRR